MTGIKINMSINSSGKTREFSSGSIRDSADGKPPFELLPWDLMGRVAIWYGLGAEKYGANNWRLGQPQSAVIGSLLRHLTKFILGYKDEDHLAAIIWNAFSLMNVDEYFSDDPNLADAGKGIPNGIQD